MILVVEREIIEQLFAVLIHAPHAILNDHRKFIGERGIVGQQVRHGAREQQTVTVLVLQALAVQRRAPGGGRHQEALRLDVAREPDLIADALGAKHRVVGVERNHVHAVRGVGRARRDERRHRAGLRDAFLKNLAVLRFVIVEQGLHVHRLILLALERVDADLAKQRVHAERARLVGNDRHDVSANRLVAEQLAENPDKCHRRGGL